MNKYDVVKNTSLRTHQQQDAIIRANAKVVEAKKKGEGLELIEDNAQRMSERVARMKSFVINPLEKIFDSIDYQDVKILDVLHDKSNSVCCILKNNSPIGTGFLISDNIIVTNNHVIPSEGFAADMEAQFNYELGKDDQFKRSVKFRLNPETFFLTSTYEKTNVPFSGLDFTLIGVNELSASGEALSDYRPSPLDGNKGKIIKGENCIVIHHPDGKPKKISIKNSAFFYDDEDFIFYESDTLFGSSGSMVVALGTGEIVALHHAGQPRMDENGNILKKDGTIATRETRDEDVDWIANKGIRVSRIIEALRQADLAGEKDNIRNRILNRSNIIRERINEVMNENPGLVEQTMVQREVLQTLKHEEELVNTVITNSKIEVDTKAAPPHEKNPDQRVTKVKFLIRAKYDDGTINSIRSFLSAQYGEGISFLLTMPDSSKTGDIELFTLTIPTTGNPEEVARQLTLVPGILNAEADLPLKLNTGDSLNTSNGFQNKESAFFSDGYGEHREDLFLARYQVSSKYVNGQSPNYYRKWNWYATGFDKIANRIPSAINEIKIVQFDTGWTNHPKVAGQFNTDADYNFIDRTDNAEDKRNPGFFKFPGHGTRTGSLLIGNEVTAIQVNGNAGLLSPANVKLIPYRIAESVVLINRQQQLADALNMAIFNKYDIITMSMGLPPTISTAVMAKKAYDAGIIWCCASGNEVQAIVAPAIFPGTIAVAASNPDDAEWSKSSRGTRIDITAPGEDVYVPIYTKPDASGNEGLSMSYGDGTSFAAPHVAAAAAYWLAEYKSDLDKKGYTGWRRVEAFRKALQKTARRNNQLPDGFGPGILDVEALLNEKPSKIQDSDYAYTGINEYTSFKVLQAYTEAVKTYWNLFHNWITGSKATAVESLTVQPPMSEYSTQLMKQVFGDSRSNLESIQSMDDAEIKRRLNILINQVQATANI